MPWNEADEREARFGDMGLGHLIGGPVTEIPRAAEQARTRDSVAAAVASLERMQEAPAVPAPRQRQAPTTSNG